MTDKAGDFFQPEEAELSTLPWSTYAIMLVLFIIFSIQTDWCGEASRGEPSIRTLVGMGGLSGDLVRSGQWTRVLNCIFLHASASHLLFNCLGLFFARGLETIVTRPWFLLIFFISGVGGSLFSISFNDPDVVSVGASGAIIGLLATQVIVAYGKYEEEDAFRETLLRRSWALLIPTFAQLTDGGTVDFSAHVGGALTGAAMGILPLWWWRSLSSRPALAAAIVANGGLAAIAIYGFVHVWRVAC